MTRYVKGSNFEREFIAEMDVKGFDGYRTAGSHTPIDVILIKRQNCPLNTSAVILCQCKRVKKNPPKPSKEFKELRAWPFVSKWWVVREDGKKTEITEVE